MAQRLFVTSVSALLVSSCGGGVPEAPDDGIRRAGVEVTYYQTMAPDQLQFFFDNPGGRALCVDGGQILPALTRLRLVQEGRPVGLWEDVNLESSRLNGVDVSQPMVVLAPHSASMATMDLGSFALEPGTVEVVGPISMFDCASIFGRGEPTRVDLSVRSRFRYDPRKG